MVSFQGVFNKNAPPPTTANDLVAIAKQFRNTPQQVKLIRWLQASTGAEKQAQFAFLWRNQQKGGAIDFVQVFQSYRSIAHQDAALRWLQQNTQPKTLQGFLGMWRNVPQTIRLNVPFFPQTDNRIDPLRACNTSSCAMVARYFGARIATDDEYFEYVSKYGDTTDHTAQTKALAELGIQSTWHQDLDYEEIDRSLAQGYPVVLGILHRGSLTNPTGGHLIVAIGSTPKRDYIFNDPFGSMLDPGGGYTGKVTNGRGVTYPRSILTPRWLVEGKNSGWGRLFYGNKLPG